MNTSPHQRLPFLLALIAAIATMPTNIYQICAWNHGTEETQPWQSALSSTPIVRSVLACRDRIRAWAASLSAHPLLASERGEASVDFLTLGAAGAMHASRLKVLRQQAEDLKADLGGVNRKLAAISDAITAANRAMTAEERTQFEALKAEKTTITQRIADNAEMLSVAEELNASVKKSDAPIATTGDDKASAKAGAVVQVHDRAADDPKRGFKDHKDFLKAVMNAGLGRRVDARLVPLKATAGSDEQGEYDNAVGGFFVPHAIAPGVLSVEPEDDPITPMLTNVPMSAPTVSFNARVDKNHATSVSGGFRVYRKPETVDGTSSRGSFEQVTLHANMEFGLAYATEEILSDSPQSFIAIIQAGFRDEYQANAMNERINGTGSGERQGLLSSGAKLSISKEGGQAAATVVKENIDNMAARCWRYGRAIWLANHNTRPQLKSLVQVIGTGGVAVPYFVTDGAPAGFDGMLDGRPLKFTEFCPTLGTEGDLILFMPSEYLEGTYQTEQYAESIHVRFISAERTFRFYRRNDGKCWWRSVLTPRNGSTLSCVVTLATRS